MEIKTTFHLILVRMSVNKKANWTNASEDMGKAPLYNAGKVNLMYPSWVSMYRFLKNTENRFIKKKV